MICSAVLDLPAIGRLRQDGSRIRPPRRLPRVAKENLPTSRWARAARVGRLAAGQGAKQLGTRVVNVTRDEEERAQALEKRQIETAEQIVAELGTMEGAAMKLGHVITFLDVGLV